MKQIDNKIKLVLYSFLLIIYFYFIINFFKYKKKFVPIAYGVNNKYIYPLIVSLTSILYNANKSTIYYFYILIPDNFLKENKRKILGLHKLFHNFKIKFYNLKNHYKDWKVGVYHSTSIYFRLSLSNIVNDFDKIIYLDCDTIIHKDLSELYNLNMNGKYYLGFAGLEIGKIIINGTRNFINSGVMLINIKELKKINAHKLYDNFYKKYGTKKYDEYLINNIFYNYIGFLPFKYGIPDFNNIKISINKFYKLYNGYCKRTYKELIEASKDPTITHGAYNLEKWWKKEFHKLSNIGKKWIFYASKSNIFLEICEYYKQFKGYCIKILKK